KTYSQLQALHIDIESKIQVEGSKLDTSVSCSRCESTWHGQDHRFGLNVQF
ncbi:uncharacterized, partial [Tachysurus ichikawai]